MSAHATEKVNLSQADLGRHPAALLEEFPDVLGLGELAEEWWPAAGSTGETIEVRLVPLGT